MVTLNGQYNNAQVFTDNLDDKSAEQITEMLNQVWIKDAKVRMMPDVHPGKGCTIGTTMTITDKIVPNLVGVDIGCSVSVYKLKSPIEIDFAKLDKNIRQNIPTGSNIRKIKAAEADEINFDELRCDIDKTRAEYSLGTLGSGNHFIEIDKDDDDKIYIVIHSGSRHLGTEVCEWYQNLATEKCAAKNDPTPNYLAYLEGEDMENYLHDMRIAQHFAALNHQAMIKTIMIGLRLNESDIDEHLRTMHNYIDLDNMILRKGAVSAQAGEKLIIPMNMRDGSLICIGKGNPDWNCSAPHGAGRILTRTQAKKAINMEEFKQSMSGIYTSCVSSGTIDEAPMVYKPMEEILSQIGDTVTVENVIKPVYNFKG